MNPEELIKVGTARQQTFTVEAQHTATHVGSGSVGVLATPWLIAFMEVTARVMLDELLPETHSTVGVRVDVRHLAASALGSTVHTRCEVQAVSGNRVTLSVAAWDSDEVIGEGSHERFVIDRQRFIEGLARKGIHQ